MCVPYLSKDGYQKRSNLQTSQYLHRDLLEPLYEGQTSWEAMTM